MCREVFEDSPSHKVIEIPKTPWDEPKASDAEQSIQHLGVNLYPDLPCAVLGVAGRVAHRWRSIEQDEEDHCSPTHHIEAVHRYEEAEGSEDEFPECFEADNSRLGPVVLPWESIAIGIGTGLVGAGVRSRCLGVRG